MKPGSGYGRTGKEVEFDGIVRDTTVTDPAPDSTEVTGLMEALLAGVDRTAA